jgi:hypothetical protein
MPFQRRNMPHSVPEMSREEVFKKDAAPAAVPDVCLRTLAHILPRTEKAYLAYSILC